MNLIDQSRKQRSKFLPYLFTTLALLFLLGQPRTVLAQLEWETHGNNINNKNSGNVGVGTTTPQSKLQVAGIITVGPLDGDIYRMYGSTSPISGWAITNSPTGFFGIAQRGAAANSSWTDLGTRLTIDRNGNVGIGTTTPPHIFSVRRNGGTAGVHNVGELFVDRDNRTRSASLVVGTAGTLKWITGMLAETDAFQIFDLGNSQPRLFVEPTNGNVGIGTTAPAAKLHVAGNLKVDGTINSANQDVAEWVSSTQRLAAGTVVTLDLERKDHVVASISAYDTKVAGVVSTQPGITLGAAGEGKVLVATTGRVRVKVDATRMPVRIGDLLVTSDRAGMAMPSVPVEVGGVQIHRPGTVIGKALEPLAGGVGEILVLLSLQ